MKMKKIYIISLPVLLILIVLGSSSCKKFLDRKPLSITSDDIPSNSLEGKALGLYGAIRSSNTDPYIGDGFENIPWVAMNGFRSDDAENIADPGASAWHQTYDNFQYTKDDWGAGMYWGKHMVLIGLCNDIIAEADASKTTDPADLINLAEAKFFRALSYFDMVRTFGEVPKYDFVPATAEAKQIAKSPVADIYKLITDDLNYGSQYLPDSWEAKFAGRLTKWAAKTLAAKAFLYQQQWSQTLSLCNDVINSGKYNLFTPYWKIFKTEGELSSESIFEIQARKVAGDANIYWSRFGQVQGIRGASGSSWDLGWGWNTPTQNLVNAYQPGDARKDATILTSGQPDGASSGGYGLTLPALTNAMYWNKKVYNQYSDYIAAGLGTPNNEAQNTWVNHRVLRYADVILMAAEAANEIGGGSNGTSAAAWVNMIRARASLPNISFVSQSQMRAAIKQERRVEFGMEFERFFDLVRWGDALNVLGPLGYQDKHKYYPIPSSAITENPKLIQNPNY